tara:strand:- start:9121 stop:9711 length:591 start_codon:yes stop_codon:yes gene_type:complete
MYIRRKIKRRIIRGSIFMVAIVLFMTVFYTGVSFVNITGNFEVPVETEEILENNFKVFENFQFDIEKKDLENYREMEIKVVPEKVVFRDECAKLTVATTLKKTEKLIRSTSGEFLIRPEEPDILEEIIDVFGITVEYIAIDDINENIFYAHMVLHDGQNVLNMDVRPSDGIVIASRTDSPVYVSENLLEEFAEITC